MPKHPHAELMMQYAQDAMETDRPWERWEVFYHDISTWVPLSMYPGWNSCNKYRRKPRHIVINGHEVPEPVRKPLPNGTIYWVPQVLAPNCTAGLAWAGDASDSRFLYRGLIHLTKEAAEAHAKALLSFTSEQS